MALRGINVIELAGIGSGPLCGLILSDFGASVVRVDRIDLSMDIDFLANGKQSVALNLKEKKGIEIFRKLCKNSDVLLEPYRAGVMESLGLGPKILLEDNPKLIYARLSGYGQYGALANKAGHDINFVAATGLLSMFHRTNEKPFSPMNLIAGFSGGSLMCSLGIVMALFERTVSGKGQIVEASIVEGVAYLASWIYRSQSLLIWGQKTGQNTFDGNRPFYETYETKDGKYMAVGAVEPKFYEELLKGLELSEDDCPQYGDSDSIKNIFTLKFSEKTQKEWCTIFNNLDACVTPVLNINEATQYPHNVERKTFVPCSDHENLIPGSAPKLSRTPAISHAMQPKLTTGQHTDSILKKLNYSEKEINQLKIEGVIGIVRNSKM